MHVFALTTATAATARITILSLVTILGVGLLPGVARGQLDVTEPNLHDAEEVYGVEVTTSTSPYANAQGISLLALGETDPLLYDNVWFKAYGLFCDVADVNLVNTGAIDVNAVGGNTTANGSVEANVRACGISGVGDVNNVGDILVAALGGTANVPASVTGVWTDADIYVDAYGIDADGDVDNAGGITVTAAGGTATTVADANNPDADADTDINVYGIDAGGNVDNTGGITVTATGGRATASVDANDVSVDADADADADAEGINAHGDVNNTGAIVVTGVGGTATATAVADVNDRYVEADADADAYALGIDASGVVTNSGAITVTATGGTATAEASVSAGASASSDVDAYIDAGAYGIYADDAVTNAGAITVKATGGTASAEAGGGVAAYSDADAWAVGIEADGDVTNTGDIMATATAGVATADANDASARAYASAGAIGIESDAAVTNTGDIVVRATGGTATASTGADDASTRASALAEAAGIYAEGALTNSGDVTVTVIGGTAVADEVRADAYVYAIYAGSDVNNAGDITAIATTEDGATAHAYGFYMDGDAALTNTGTIRATGDQAYEVYVASGTTTLGDVYNVTLDGDPNDASFYVCDGAALALNDATLTVTSVSGETLWDTEHQLFETTGTGVVDGNFVDVQATNPDTTATYYNQGTTGSTDDTVALSYTPAASEPTGATAVEKQLVSQSIDLVNHRMTGTLLQSILSPGTSGLLADAGPVSRSLGLGQSGSGSASGVFVEPYYSRMEHDANPLGYDADLWGFAAGYERQMDDTLISLHAGYGQADVGYTGAGYSANSEDQDLLTAGFGGLTRWSEWTLRYGLTGFYGWHDYQGRTGLALGETEEGETDSYGLVASAMVGRIFRKDSHVFLPEVGLTYLWGHRQRYTTDASDSAWDTTYSAMNDHDVQAVAALHWLCGFLHNDVHVTPSASIGVRRLLTDGDSTVTQSVPGATPVAVTSERDRTALTLSGSVVLRKTRHSLSLAYDGEYSPDTERHSLWLRYGWQF